MTIKNITMHNKPRKSLIALYIGMMLPVAVIAQDSETTDYTISPGDTLGTLAEKIEQLGGSHYQRQKLIRQANPLVFGEGKGNFLQVGSVIALPNSVQTPPQADDQGISKLQSDKQEPNDPFRESSAGNAEFRYQIKNGDTLGNLAEKILDMGGSHTQRRRRIIESNPQIFSNSNQDALLVGSVMVIQASNKQSDSAATDVDVAVTPAEETVKKPEISEPEVSYSDSKEDKSHKNNDHKEDHHHAKVLMSPTARYSEHNSSVFSSDPDYTRDVYNAQAQKKIYGDKRAVPTPRPLLELGRPQYQNGPLTRTTSIIGERNKVAPALSIYGDARSALAFNDNGAGGDNDLFAARLNLDIDLKLTGTERLHAFVRPLDKNNEFTRISINGDDEDDDEFILDGNLETLFFEGDLGAIVGGLADKPSTFDLPFSIGLMPLLFQNGVWLEDAFTGIAFTIPAQNSKRFDISNFDITFFAGFDEVSSLAIRDEFGQVADNDVNVYGIASFWEVFRGYAEVDYAFIDGRDQFDQFDHHSFSFAFTKRFRDIASSSIRVISTFGQDLDSDEETAGGTLLLWENSLITSRPSTFIPYMNFYAAFDRPQSVARDNGGLLKNVGINFETDTLTGYPLLDDSGQDSFGGAIGIQNLFSLNQQLVVELAAVKLMDSDNPLGKAKGDQLAFGIRYQRPLTKAWLLRADAIKGWLEDDDNIDGIRFELRRKF